MWKYVITCAVLLCANGARSNIFFSDQVCRETGGSGEKRRLSRSDQTRHFLFFFGEMCETDLGKSAQALDPVVTLLPSLHCYLRHTVTFVWGHENVLDS